MGQFLDALNEIALADADKATLADLAARYPDLDKRVVSASAHTAVVTSAQQFKAKLDANQVELDKWNTWFTDNWDPEAKNTKQAVQLQERAEILARRVATLESAIAAGEGGNTMALELDQLKEFLKTEGVVTSSQLTGFAKTEDIAGVNKALNQQAVNFEHIYFETTPLLLKFDREFGQKLGKDFDIRGFVNFATTSEDRMKDLGKTYEEFVAPLRSELDLKARADKLTQDQADFDAKVAAANLAAAGHSATEGADGMEAGHFATRLRNGFKAPEDSGEINLPLENMNLSAMAAEQHRKGATHIQ